MCVQQWYEEKGEARRKSRSSSATSFTLWEGTIQFQISITNSTLPSFFFFFFHKFVLKVNVLGELYFFLNKKNMCMYVWQTDTASVLYEAMGYIRFLQEQIQVLCSPYLQQNLSFLLVSLINVLSFLSILFSFFGFGRFRFFLHLVKTQGSTVGNRDCTVQSIILTWIFLFFFLGNNLLTDLIGERGR